MTYRDDDTRANVGTESCLPPRQNSCPIAKSLRFIGASLTANVHAHRRAHSHAL